LVVGHGDIEAIAKLLERRAVHFFLLMGDIHALAGGTHAVALDGLGENDGGLSAVSDGSRVGGVNLDHVVAAAAEFPYFAVGHGGDHLKELGILAEEFGADVGTVAGL